MMVINKAETQEGISLIFFSYHYPHRSILLAAPFNLLNWQSGSVAL